MLKQNILQGLAHMDDPELYLSDMCDGIESGGYTRKLSADELTSKREELSSNYISLARIGEEFDHVKAEFKKKRKPFEMELRRLSLEVNNGFVEEKGNLFKIIDRESEMVGFYDKNGDLVNSRTLLPEERQISILENRQ